MANLSQLTLPVKDTITGIVTPTTFDLAGSDSKNFIGTRTEWEALTQAEKEEYDTMDIYGEYNDSPIDPVPTSGSTNAVASGGVYSAIAAAVASIEDPKVYISGVEESSTASQAYTVGSYLIYDGALYKVISSIALGDTLVINTNISATKIADEVSNHLCVNGTEFYFDSHDGKFGYNTSANRGADTFVPFSSGGEVYYIINNSAFQNGHSFGGVTYTRRDTNTSITTASPTDLVCNAHADSANHYVSGRIVLASNIVGKGQLLGWKSSRISSPPANTSCNYSVGYAKSGTTSFTWLTNEKGFIKLPNDGETYVICAQIGITYINNSYVGYYTLKQRLTKVVLITMDSDSADAVVAQVS